MEKKEWTLSSLHKEKYGAWAGKPAGTPPDPNCCCEEVREKGRWPRYYQCYKKRGHGPEQAYCATHDPEKVAARLKKRDEVYEAKWNAQRVEWDGPKFLEALKQIADGHNDPRTLAKETIKEYVK